VAADKTRERVEKSRERERGSKGVGREDARVQVPVPKPQCKSCEGERELIRKAPDKALFTALR
jgi:hypothetical protein